MKYLVALLWPLGIAAIVGIGYLVARRATGTSLFRRASDRLPGPDTSGAFRGSVKLIAIAVTGALAVVAFMLALGAAWVVHHGSTIDQPIYRFTIDHQVHHWVRLMKRLTKVGNTWTTWGAAGAAAACLAVTWRSRKWLPPVVLGTVVVLDHYATLGIRHVFERVGPPNSPHGTYPSGGCERVILFYGLIAYLLWREHSGRREAGIWAGVGVAVLAYNEAYSRTYLTLHWFTDAVSGLVYGTLLLVVFIVAVRIVAGPPRRPGEVTAPERRRHSAPAAEATG